MLYTFEKLAKNLDNLGFPRIQGGSGFQIIRGIDFEVAYKSGSISFEDDGIYLEYEGKKYRGYMFIQEAYITYNGGPIKFPKFHLLKCRVIQEFISSGKFKLRYEWSNSDVNNLIDKQTRTKYNDRKLQACTYCKSDYIEAIEDTEDFFDSLDKTVLEENNIEVDIFGYVRGKEKISRDFRNQLGFTCEKCSIRPKTNLHKRWWHTHHVDGDKTNNILSNLKCYCIVCHSNVDTRHRENFSKGSMQKQLNFFKMEYKNELKKLNNPYV
jgi:hypothetical protein